MQMLEKRLEIRKGSTAWYFLRVHTFKLLRALDADRLQMVGIETRVRGNLKKLGVDGSLSLVGS